ncbi:MAG: SOS response-associated peptidase, partial [bacterium]
PSWAKDPSVGARMINARSETLAEKPAFRNALKRRRCLIVADGFYEWQKQPGGKVPMFITLKDRQPFGFAGLYETWTEPESGASVTTCTIITGPANALVAPIHDRMPIILPSGAYDRWLDPQEMNTALLTDLLKPYPAGQMMAYPVSARVNAPTFDDPSLIERAG